MRAVILCWEYPPRTVGKLSEYVNGLAAQLVKNRVKTHVVTYNDASTGTVKEEDGVWVSRVANPVHTHDSLLTWDLTLNQEIERAAANVYYQAGKHLDLTDVYDWHFIPAAVTLKNALGIPFVYSVDSLEDHRSPGANEPFNMSIRGIEWLGFFEAEKVTVKSEWMKNEVIRLYNVPPEKIVIVSSDTASLVKDVLAVYRAVAGGDAKT
ncbi:MAG: glycosyltransferase [Candidatus Bathyarchaeota archaeon]|nr:glycosyltransferase [Candidatus Bathyarchaeota archaeon]